MSPPAKGQDKAELRLKLDDRLEVCKVCGYAGGFHILLQRMGAPGKAKVRLKCPSCGQVYDLGLSVAVS